MKGSILRRDDHGSCVITRRCVAVKDQSCVEVYPVDCIHPSSELDGREAYDAAPQLYIDRGCVLTTGHASDV